ncbi:MAG TPA: L,D-transpeptidase family protein [Gemmatimonadaceae bacterium]|nr:L,D-transpeptidase family protein [Gemmatimonadaceae bacterium]
MRRLSSVVLAVLVLGAACRARPVSVVTPEMDRDAADLTPLSSRGDTSWRTSAVSDLQTHSHGVQAVVAPAPVVTTRTTVSAVSTGTAVTAISPASINEDPSPDALEADEGPAVLRTQIMLDRAHFSSGVLNGKAGQNMSKAVLFYQQENGLPATGRLDQATYAKLVDEVGRIDGAVQYTLTEDDIIGPYLWIPASVYDQEKLPCECYASALEMLDERFHTVTDVLRKLNPTVNFNHLAAGMTLWVPNVEPFDAEHLHRSEPVKPIVKIHVAKSGRYLHALAADGSIVYHFPTTVGSEYDPSPSGRYRVEGVQWHPVFHYDPSLYSDVPDSRPRATLEPGPNSPVGIVWIATSKEHVGIHGTPLPHTIGLASSHGCVRLTNWDAARLAAAIKPGVVIEFVD